MGDCHDLLHQDRLFLFDYHLFHRAHLVMVVLCYLVCYQWHPVSRTIRLALWVGAASDSLTAFTLSSSLIVLATTFPASLPPFSGRAHTKRNDSLNGNGSAADGQSQARRGRS